MSEVAGNEPIEPSLAASLRVAPTSDERLAALEGERAREQAAIRELEARLAEAAAHRSLMNERERFVRTAQFAFALGGMGLLFVILWLARGFC